QICFY
ncbi:hypothetical protein D043_1446B, partial [Vibrio parahaemolyticus EKP-021]